MNVFEQLLKKKYVVNRIRDGLYKVYKISDWKLDVNNPHYITMKKEYDARLKNPVLMSYKDGKITLYRDRIKFYKTFEIDNVDNFDQCYDELIQYDVDWIIKIRNFEHCELKLPFIIDFYRSEILRKNELFAVMADVFRNILEDFNALYYEMLKSSGYMKDPKYPNEMKSYHISGFDLFPIENPIPSHHFYNLPKKDRVRLIKSFISYQRKNGKTYKYF